MQRTNPSTRWDEYFSKKRKIPKGCIARPECILTDSFRYLTADYERGVFNVSQCAWIEGAKEHVVTITSKDAGDGSLTDTISSGRGGEGAGTGGVNSDPVPESQPLSSGAIVGIVVGVVMYCEGECGRGVRRDIAFGQSVAEEGLLASREADGGIIWRAVIRIEGGKSG